MGHIVQFTLGSNYVVHLKHKTITVLYVAACTRLLAQQILLLSCYLLPATLP